MDRMPLEEQAWIWADIFGASMQQSELLWYGSEIEGEIILFAVKQLNAIKSFFVNHRAGIFPCSAI